MKIAYLSIDDPKDYISWSGLKLNMYKTLKKLNHEIKIVGPFKDEKRIPFILKRETLKLFKIKYDSERKDILSKLYANKINNFVNKNKIDLIFTSDTYLVSHIDTHIPIILWLDVTYKTYYEYYFKGEKLHRKSFLEANNLEKLALNRAKIIILTSQWSKEETLKNYKISSKKIKVIPFGSNLGELKILKKKKKYKKNYLNLVSIGVDWNRKGMDKTIKIIKYLNDKGIDANLSIIGSTNKNKIYPNYIKQIGFLNKNIKKDHAKLINIISNSDLHILMTNKEACGVVFAEVNSYGIFNITNKTGGVEGMIRNNFNGKLFKLSDSVNKIGDYIINILNNNKKFLQLKKNSKNYYKKKISWKANSPKLQKILLQAIK